MDTSAGISLRPSASLLCVLNGGDPIVAARAKGYRDGRAYSRPEEPAPPERGLLGGIFHWVVGTAQSPDSNAGSFPFDLAGDLLAALKASTPRDAPNSVAIAVPSYAHDEQRQRVVIGAKAAGWDVLGLVNEPTAAAMASGVLRDGEGTVLVYDLAESRFDATIVAFRDTSFEILSTDGLPDTGHDLDLKHTLANTEAPCRRALDDAKLGVNGIDTVILVGEICRQTQTIEFVSELFGRAPLTRFDPEEVVGFGAAAHASILESR